MTAHRGRWPIGREARDARQHGDGARTPNEVGVAHFRISGMISSTSKVYQSMARFEGAAIGTSADSRLPLHAILAAPETRRGEAVSTSMKLKTWLRPGMLVKRWILLLLGGLISTSLAMAMGLAYIYRNVDFPSATTGVVRA